MFPYNFSYFVVFSCTFLSFSEIMQRYNSFSQMGKQISLSETPFDR